VLLLSDKKLFKEEYEKSIEEESKSKSKWLLTLLAIYIKLNSIMLWITVLLNGLFIAFMLMDFNVGIILFLFNQYFVILYLIKTRKERKEKRDKMMIYDSN